MAEDLLEHVLLRFDGGIASGGHMHLYEYSRAQYGFARILTTIEQFRRSGKVIDKVSKNQKVTLIVSAPEKGSFELDIKIAVRDASETYLSGIPFELLLSVVLDRLIPKGEEYSNLVSRLAKIQVAEKPEDVEWLKTLTQISDGGVAQAEDALRVVRHALNSSNPAIGRAEIDPDDIRRAQLFLESDVKREEIIDKYHGLAGKIDYSELDKLVAKVRPIFSEVAVPFSSSATNLTIGRGKNKDKYYRLDGERLDFIKSRVLDETEVELRVRIKSYDRETGTGRMRSDNFVGVKSFQVDPDVRGEVQPEIIRAMNRRDVTLGCARYTDKNGIVTSYVVRSIS